MALFKGFPRINWLDWYPGQRVNSRPPAQTEPFVSDCPGFNTRFSLFDLEQKEAFGKELTKDESKYLAYVRSLES